MFSLNTGGWYSPQVFQMSKIWPGTGGLWVSHCFGRWGLHGVTVCTEQAPHLPHLPSPSLRGGQVTSQLSWKSMCSGVMFSGRHSSLWLSDSTPQQMGSWSRQFPKPATGLTPWTAKSWSMSKRGKIYILGRERRVFCLLECSVSKKWWNGSTYLDYPG